MVKVPKAVETRSLTTFVAPTRATLSAPPGAKAKKQKLKMSLDAFNIGGALVLGGGGAGGGSGRRRGAAGEEVGGTGAVGLAGRAGGGAG
jgi:hypothetical protein